MRAKCALALGGRHITDEEAKEAVAALISAVKDEDEQVNKNALYPFTG